MAEVVIVASAFGADKVRRDGHRACAALAARAGAAGFEVRRELLADPADTALRAWRELGAALRAEGLWTVYSTPAALYDDTGTLDETALRLALVEAQALGARIAKLQLGGFAAGAADGMRIDALARELAPAVRVVVENGQLVQGGSIAQFVRLFETLRDEGHAQALGMTFDIGNWQWPGEAPIEAARQLAAHVEYIHCKAVEGNGSRRFAGAPAADDPLCAQVLRMLPQAVPRGIEFPFDAARLEADAARYVAWLAAA